VHAEARGDAEQELAFTVLAALGGEVVVRGVDQRKREEQTETHQSHQRRESVLHDEPPEAHRECALGQLLLHEALRPLVLGHAYSPAPVAGGGVSGFGSISYQSWPALVERSTLPPWPTIQHTVGVPQVRSRK